VHVRSQTDDPDLIGSPGLLVAMRERVEALLPLLHFLDDGMQA